MPKAPSPGSPPVVAPAAPPASAGAPDGGPAAAPIDAEVADDTATQADDATQADAAPADGGDAPGREPAAGGLRLGPWVVRLAVALTLAPLAVSAVAMSLRYGGDHRPIGDLASAELVTRDVGRYAVPLGPFSRDGWHHPGPALYYVMAVPYRLLGSTSTAMNVGALAVNAAAVAGIAVAARRRGGDALMLVALLGCALLMRSLGPDELRVPWNPYVTVLPYALLIFLTWGLMCRDRWALPLAVLVASFVAQTHIGYVSLALPLLAVGAAWLVASMAREARRLVAPVAVAVVVGVVMWLPPVVQQLTHEPGNLGVAIRWFRDGGLTGADPRGPGAGWRVVSSQLGLPPVWLTGSRELAYSAEPVYLDDPMAPVLLAVVAVAALVLARRRTAGARRLVGLWVLASAVGVGATAATVGPIYGYRVGWALVLGMVAGVIVAWAGWLTAVHRRPGLERRLLVPVALGSLAVLAVVGTVAHVRAGEPFGVQSRRAAELVPAVVAGLPAGEGSVVIDGSPSFEGFGYVPTLVLGLERRGIDGRLPAGDTSAGEHRAADDDGAHRAELVVAAGIDIARVEADPRLTMLTYSGDVGLAEVRARAAEQEPLPSGSAVAVFLVGGEPVGPVGET